MACICFGMGRCATVNEGAFTEITSPSTWKERA
jgi:hypothetical protein